MITIKEWADGISLHRDDNEIAYYSFFTDTVNAHGATDTEIRFLFDIIECFEKLNRRENQKTRIYDNKYKL